MGQLKERILAEGSFAKGHFGVAGLLIEEGERFSVHGTDHFPMQSVYKLPIAMATLDLVDRRWLSLRKKIRIDKSLYSSVHSPIRNRYPEGGVDLAMQELLSASIVESDNTASDALLRLVGASGVESFLQRLHVLNVRVVDSEKAMSLDRSVQYRNWASPDGMVQLLCLLQQAKVLSPQSRTLLLGWMTDSRPGAMRIKGLLPPATPVAHKTGTSATWKGLTPATNDVGIVTLPDGRHFAIAVLIADSTADENSREAVIAKITRTVWDFWLR